jgi:signal transduction histidine kinase
MRLPTPAFIRSSLRNKFLFLLLAILVLLSGLISLVFILYQVNNQKAEIASRAKAFSSLSALPIGNAYGTYFDSGFIKFKEITDNILSLDNSVSKIQIISIDGQIIFDSKDASQVGKIINEQEFIEAVSDDQATSFRNGTGDLESIIEPYFDDFGAHPVSIRYYLAYDSLNEYLLRTIPLAIFVILLVAVFSGILVVLTVNRTILEPVEQIVLGAGLVSKGKLEHRIDLKTNDELQSLAGAVNNMASSLQKYIEALKDLDRLKDEFIIIASHNLRTPLTAIKGYISILGSEEKIKGAVAPTLEKITQASAKLEAIVEELINIVSIETKGTIASKTRVDLGNLLNDLLLSFKSKAEERKILLSFQAPESSLLVSGDEAKLKVAFNNLFDNAIKFNKEGGTVQVSVGTQESGVVVKVADTGIGISEKEVPLVFKKFHRATDILQYNYEGLGLGLYLTRVIVEAHGGRVWFDSSQGVGSNFYVGLPLDDG